jgi:hypothetical protein
MTLPKNLTTITPLSKTLAIILFIVFPLVGFLIGMKYQQLNTLNPTTLSNITNIKSNPINKTASITPTPLITIDESTGWNIYAANDEFKYQIEYSPNLYVIKRDFPGTMFFTIKLANSDNYYKSPYFFTTIEWDPEQCKAECDNIVNSSTINLNGYQMRKLTGFVAGDGSSQNGQKFIYYVVKPTTYSSDGNASAVIIGYENLTANSSDIPNYEQTLYQMANTFRFIK